MQKKIIDKFRDKLQPNDIVLEEYSGNFDTQNLALIGYHATRLYDAEYVELKKEGFKSTTKKFFAQKLQNISNVKYRKYLLKKLKLIDETQSDGKIFLKFGKADFAGIDTIFLRNWGGETIYNLYDHNGLETEYEKEIGNYLRNNTKPYIVVCRIKDNFYCKYVLTDELTYKYGVVDCFDVGDIEIVDIIYAGDIVGE